jgi:hypothetical protein
MSYPLYSTLNVNIKKKDLTKTRKAELVKRVKKMTKLEYEAVLMLICEHARCVEGHVFGKRDIKLPYHGTTVNKNTVFDLEKLPNELKWILWQFVCVLNEQESN